MILLILFIALILLPSHSHAIPICLATASPPSLIEGQNYPCSLDLNANERVSGSFSVSPPALNKGTQGSTGYSVQALKDAGRSFVGLSINFANTVTTEALLSVNINAGGTVTTATSYTVTAGKILVVQNITYTITDNTASCLNTINLRSGPTVTVTSPVYATLAMSPNSATHNFSTALSMDFPDGIMFQGGSQIALSTVADVTSCQQTISLVGYEY